MEIRGEYASVIPDRSLYCLTKAFREFNNGLRSRVICGEIKWNDAGPSDNFRFARWRLKKTIFKRKRVPWKLGDGAPGFPIHPGGWKENWNNHSARPLLQQTGRYALIKFCTNSIFPDVFPEAIFLVLGVSFRGPKSESHRKIADINWLGRDEYVRKGRRSQRWIVF